MLYNPSLQLFSNNLKFKPHREKINVQKIKFRGEGMIDKGRVQSALSTRGYCGEITEPSSLPTRLVTRCGLQMPVNTKNRSQSSAGGALIEDISLASSLDSSLRRF